MAEDPIPVQGAAEAELYPLAFDTLRDTRFAQPLEGFERVLHVFDTGWNGIRSACGALPGHKLAITHPRRPDAAAIRHFVGLVSKWHIERICFHGYSDSANDFVEAAARFFGSSVGLYIVTHVGSAQFTNGFEIRMQELTRRALAQGAVRRLGSLKPGFHLVNDACWPHTLINMAPALGHRGAAFTHREGTAFVPLENTWGKNLYNNIIATLRSDMLNEVWTVNWPTSLGDIMDLSRLRQVGFRRGLDLLTMMASAEVVMNVSHAEAQPMTQLEALAVGTPCLTGPLHLPELGAHAATALLEAPPDDIGGIMAAIRRVAEARRSDPAGMAALFEDLLEEREHLSAERYAEFLEL